MISSFVGLVEKRSARGFLYYVNNVGEVICKECSKCGTVKNLEDFHRQKVGIGGTRADCRDCVKYYSRKYRDANRTKLRDYARQYYANNAEKEREYSRRYYAENPEKDRMRDLRRRARKASLPDSLTESQWRDTLDYFGGACAFTGVTEDLHRDHVLPLSIGHGGTTKENMLPVSSRINLSKCDNNVFVWYEENGVRLGICPERFERAIGYLAELNGMSVSEYRDYVYDCHANPNDIVTEVL